MAAPSIQVQINPESERSIITYATLAQNLLLNQYSLRGNLEILDRYYMREMNWTQSELRARLANLAGDAHKIRDITVPIVMPQVESALNYMQEVFLTGYPIFGAVADPANMDAALQMETINAENAIMARWSRELTMFFRDGLKYNLHGLELEWQQRNVASLEVDITNLGTVKPKTELWHGNVLKRMDLYNTFFDPRVHPAEIHEKGEYAGYVEMYSRVALKKMINDLYGRVSVKTAIRAMESAPGITIATGGSSPFSYYQPLINPFPFMDRNNLQTFDWMAWAGNYNANKQGIQYSNVYQVTKLYARILPADFGLRVPEENTPQVWKFYIVNGSVVIFAERQTNAHGYIPIFFGQPLEDGLDYQTKSFAANVTDMQDIGSAMMNGYIASKRRLVGDRVLYDPLRVSKKDINSTNPAAKIPVRPSAYGKPVNESVYQFPYRDEQTNSLVDGARIAMSYADQINGQNPVKQGQFVKGNKTRSEFQDTMGHSNGRNKSMALMTEIQVFTPLKEALKLNILQYQPETVLFNTEQQREVTIQPETLRKKAVKFKISDGMLPSDKMLSSDTFQVALQAMGQYPQLAAGYNVTPMFSYLMKQQGADLRPFEKSPLQLQFEQMQMQWQQMAMEAMKAGQQPPPQPQMPPELVAELQQKQQTGGAYQTPTTAAAESTQGNA